MKEKTMNTNPVKIRRKFDETSMRASDDSPNKIPQSF
jgi:hypothetical protein